ncbi:hypothetical protein BGZ61DRAFT_455100 [Ilyonectria robusta]|uniref:uncharacterized protein n=1 Tax=Ilyonectria robusta TaxID=1079257 RepID=UPI001E8CE2AD|nr:uncharacterized protein BGZ61DRAFT_455100 [Ilyonectria robusta]KAH8685212.1 hypothetical protein BGZ61DRAFT_455100 [Ilyonectria robusta]
MFKWYQQSSICYVFLSDFKVPSTSSLSDSSVTDPSLNTGIEPDDTSFFSCRWFDRGWTLQELIAPRIVDFFDQDWTKFGSRDDNLLDRLCDRTGISPQVFSERRCSCQKVDFSSLVRNRVCRNCRTLDKLLQTLDSFAVSIKMSWASSRMTTRKEDAAYCLLGQFDINMPMLYGEDDKAFMRLQDAILRRSKDQSIFLWRAEPSDIPQGRAMGCLAPASANFRDPIPIIGRQGFGNNDQRYEEDFLGNMAPMEITDTALKVNIWLCPGTVTSIIPGLVESLNQSLWLGILDLAYEDDYLARPAIILEDMGVFGLYRRAYNQLIVRVNPRDIISEHILSHEGSYPGPLFDLGFIYSLDKAIRKDVKILLKHGPINAVKMPSNSYEEPTTGPLYLITDLDESVHFETDSGRSHPPLNQYSARTTELSAPWRFERCEHGSNRFLGGAHFVNFHSEWNGQPSHQVSAVIIWGTHRDDRATNEERLWCRVFYMHALMKEMGYATKKVLFPRRHVEEDDISPRTVQHKMEAFRKQLCKPPFGQFLISQRNSKKFPQKTLFPESCDERYVKDGLPNVINHCGVMLGLTANISRTKGLGRTLYELRISIKAMGEQI